MITHHQYLHEDISHRDYYAQFVTQDVKDLVTHWITMPVLLASDDPNLNDIPLRKWDAVASALPLSVWQMLHEAGDELSLRTGLLIVKEAAQQIIEEV